MEGAFRLIDSGVVTGLRSQTTWHAIAEAMHPGDAPVLSILRPGETYVSIGYHVPIGTIDEAVCLRRGLSIYRRRAGGGPVLCDPNQLFFQIVVPAASAPKRRDHAWQRYLGPAVEAFRRLGADAALGPGNDVCADGLKVCGTGAAEIGDALVFVGNVIFDFDYEAMADVLRLPSPWARTEVERLMRRFLAPLHRVTGAPTTPDAATGALVGAYAAAFGRPRPDELTADELSVRDSLDRLFVDPRWVRAERTRGQSAVKIRSGVGVVLVRDAVVSIVDGRIERVVLGDGWVPAPGMRRELARALEGLPLDRASLEAAVARAWGPSPWGRELVETIVRAHSAWS
jgi:lipoate-protein ligase A